MFYLLSLIVFLLFYLNSLLFISVTKIKSTVVNTLLFLTYHFPNYINFIKVNIKCSIDSPFLSPSWFIKPLFLS